MVSMTLALFLMVPAEEPEIPPVARAEVEKLHRELIPRAVEAWETVEWRTDLLAACEEAVRRGRPVFLWAMNGHPLGCV
jgi:hypothetical protein